MKRVPIPVVILLSLGVVALPWWYWTRNMDFLEPPSDFQLARIRADVASSFPTRTPLYSDEDGPLDAQAIQSPIKAAPVIDPGDPHAPATLDAYREHSKAGAAAFIALAVHLEEQSGNARALLAWERVLDACQADESQRQAAFAGVERLRPLVAPWFIDPLKAEPLLLETSVPADFPPDILESALQKVADSLGKRSAGLLRFEPLVTRQKPPPKAAKKPVPTPKKRTEAPAEPPPPPARISLQILHKGAGGASTGLTDFGLPEDTTRLPREILGAAYKLIASQLAAATDLTPPEPLAPAAAPLAALSTRITRLCWSEFGKSLKPVNPP